MRKPLGQTWRWLLVRAWLRAKELGRSEHTVWRRTVMLRGKVARFCKEGRSGLRDRRDVPIAHELARRNGRARRAQSGLGVRPVGVVVAAAVSAASATVGQDSLRVVVCRQEQHGRTCGTPETGRCSSARGDWWRSDPTMCGRSTSRAGSGRRITKRVGPLTVRDAAGRYVLEARHVGPRDAEVDAAMCRLFREIRTSSRHPSRQRPAVWQLRPAGLDDVEPEMGQAGHRGAVWPAGLSPGQCGART